MIGGKVFVLGLMTGHLKACFAKKEGPCEDLLPFFSNNLDRLHVAFYEAVDCG